MLILRYVSSCGSRCRPSAGRETLATRTHRESASIETRILHFRMCHGVAIHVTGAKLPAGNASRATEVRIMHGRVHVRESRATVQGSEAAAVPGVKANRTEAPTVPAIPRMEMIARSEWKPPKSAAIPEAEAKSETAAEAKERNISRRPNRTVKRISINR